MKFDPQEIKLCSSLFRDGKSTLEVQMYLSNKYKLAKHETSNFVKLVRKSLGIYNKVRCQVSSDGRASH